jgi:predicted transcriptional regulator
MKIAEYLKNNNISVNQFAESVGVDRQNVYKWIKGTVPRKSVIQKIVEVTNGNVNIGDFYAAVPAIQE